MAFPWGFVLTQRYFSFVASGAVHWTYVALLQHGWVCLQQLRCPAIQQKHFDFRMPVDGYNLSNSGHS